MSVYPVSAGHPSLSSDSTNKYIAAIYSSLLVKKFYPKTVFGKISQTDYEGEIKEFGDTVYIRTRATIETFRYKKGMVLPVQNPESAYISLKIDQGEGFSVALDKVDEFQTDLELMKQWGEDGAEQLKQVLDLNGLISIAAAGAVAGGQLATTVTGYSAANDGPDLSGFTTANKAIVAGGTTIKGSSIAAGTTAGTNMGTSAAAVSADTGDKLTAQILLYNRYLDENNAPDEGRFCVLPTWCRSVLLGLSSNNFGLAYATGQNTAPILSGTIPKIDRMDIMFSNNMPTTTQATTDPGAAIFGCKYATTFATQITESRIIDNPFAFGKLLQGLQVYGLNIIKPSVLGVDFLKKA